MMEYLYDIFLVLIKFLNSRFVVNKVSLKELFSGECFNLVANFLTLFLSF